MGMKTTPTLLIVLDGWGVAEKGAGNAIGLASIPSYTHLWKHSAHGYLHASGEAVGLPSGTNGNSEVGHMNIGAGFVVPQELSRINIAIADKTFFQNPQFLGAINHCMQYNSNLHCMGLLSNGNVHASIAHFKALLACLAMQKYPKEVYLHLFSDGRDTEQQSFLSFYRELQHTCSEYGKGKVVHIVGRYFAMDRNKRWERTKQAYDLLVHNIGSSFPSVEDAITAQYAKHTTDEFLPPMVIGEQAVPIQSSDAVIFVNFREDRALQLSQAFVDDTFSFFSRGDQLHNLFFVGMTQYNEQLPIHVAFPMIPITHPLGKVLSEQGLLQFRIAETEKYAHVTYFFNGGREVVFPGEERVMIPSPKVATYDLKPQMSAYEITDRLLEAIDTHQYDFLLVNFANADMVGHTGNIPATIQALEAVDACIERLTQKIFHEKGQLFLTADHGNAEEMLHYTNGHIDTEHSTNLVPFLYTNGHTFPKELGIGILADVAPTILAMLHLEKPDTMTGRNLLLP